MLDRVQHEWDAQAGKALSHCRPFKLEILGPVAIPLLTHAYMSSIINIE